MIRDNNIVFDKHNSTLYQLDNAMAELHFAMFKALDSTSWIDNNQFMISTNSSIVDFRREFENRYGKFQYPSLVVNRSYRLEVQPHNNMNVENLYIVQDDLQIKVRPVTINYTCSIIDSRRQYIDEYYESALLNLYKYAPRVDVKCKVGIKDKKEVIVHNLASIVYDIDQINISTTPSYDDKTNNTGQVYVLSIPFTVDTQLLGDYQESKLIHEMIVNYVDMRTDELIESDQFTTVPKHIKIEEGNK